MSQISIRKRGLAAAALAATTVTMIPSQAFAGVGGGGVTSGGGGGGGGTDVINFWTEDDMTKTSTNAPTQGWGQASIEHFKKQIEAQWPPFNDTKLDGDLGVWNPATNKSDGGACSDAIVRAIARTPGAKTARVVQVGVAIMKNPQTGKFTTWGAAESDWRRLYDDNWPSATADLVDYTPAQEDAVYGEFQNNIAANSRVVCVALNDLEQKPTYKVKIDTTALNTFPNAGTTQLVRDQINATATLSTGGKPARETLASRIYLFFRDPSGRETHASKTLNIWNDGQTLSPTFAPTDFGWTTWQQGTYYYSLGVPKQKGMSAAVDTGNLGDAGFDMDESWKAGPDNYTIAVDTKAQNTFKAEGGTEVVFDSITTKATAPAGVTIPSENLAGRVYLNFIGLDDSKTHASYPMTINNNKADQKSPDFKPSDFGWTKWPAGTFWFDVTIDKSGKLAQPVDTPNYGTANFDADEAWAPTPNTYSVKVDTAAKNTFTAPGGAATVADDYTVTPVADANVDPASIAPETLQVETVLHWVGPKGETGLSTKTSPITTKGGDAAVTGTSKTFSPSDFGWTDWKEGTYWYDTRVAKTDRMLTAYDAADFGATGFDADESWKATTPPPTEKVLRKADGVTALPANANLAAGQTYVADISSEAANYAHMGLRDTIHTDQVFIGAATADDVTKVSVKVTDATGKDVTPADFKPTATLARTAGQVVVTSEFDIPAALVGKGYTFHLMVPTTVKPTGANYDIKDTPSREFPGEPWSDGTPKQTEKITPTPDKAWVLDETGALVTNDPKWTNKVAADEKTFMPGEKVASVANGHVPANLPDDLARYIIRDDWSDATKYVDFTDNSMHKVFADMNHDGVITASEDVTSQFVVATVNGVTTATAKPGSAFLKETGSLAKTMDVKLVLNGKFRTDYDTKGELVKMINKGSETWNSETKPTNEPPVYTKTFVPNKDVVGAEEQGADGKTSINAQKVLPGQVVKYRIGVDLRTPNQASEEPINSLVVEDAYDKLLVPNKDSVKFVDARTGKEVDIPADAYSLKWDDANHKFSAIFTPEWLKANMKTANGDGFLYMTFTGKVVASAPDGSVIKNQAWQITNGSRQATNIPTITVPPYEPHKEDLDTQGHNIDGKTVLQGDKIVYRLTLDGGLPRAQLAYNVHKLGMVDDFDERYLDTDASKIVVLDKATGEDVTAQFNTAVIDGRAYVDAKTGKLVDGKFVAGTQSSDLSKRVGYCTLDGDTGKPTGECVGGSEIVPATDDVIDQNLLGRDFYVMLTTTVKQDADKTIWNQAWQNTENNFKATEIVSNDLKDIDPSKDITIDVNGKSINGSTIELDTLFNYKLNSSTIPEKRAYDSSQWGIKDKFNVKYDTYTRVWAVYASTDIYDGDKLVLPKGGLIQNSEGKTQINLGATAAPAPSVSASATPSASTPASASAPAASASATPSASASAPANGTLDLPLVDGKFFTSTYDTKTAEASYDATEDFFKLINTRKDLPQGWSVYAKMQRIAPSPKVTNVHTETYNTVDRPSNEVWTKTPEHPAIDVEKYTFEEGMTKGDRDKLADAFGLTEEQVKDQIAAKPNGIKIGFKVTNTGNTNLKNVALSDKTFAGTGKVTGIICSIPVNPAVKDGKMQQVAADKIGSLLRTQSIDCFGTLTGVEGGSVHSDKATVTGQSVFTGVKVTDNDDWHGKGADKPAVDVEKYTLSEGLEAGDRDKSEDALTVSGDTQIGFKVTNTGISPLKDVVLSDKTTAGTGSVKNITCTVDGKNVSGGKIGSLAVGQVVDCRGTVSGVQAGTSHTDKATVTALSKHTGAKVTDNDDWNAKREPAQAAAGNQSDNGGDNGGAETGGQRAQQRNEDMAKKGLFGLLSLAGLGAIGAGLSRRKKITE